MNGPVPNLVRLVKEFGTRVNYPLNYIAVFCYEALHSTLTKPHIHD